MTGEALREIYEAILPTDTIEFFATQLGVVERRRRLDIVALVRAAVVATSSPSGGLQADVIRNYAESGAPRLARSAMYGKFDEEFEVLMQMLAENALEYAQKQKLDLPGILAGVKDWRIVDSSTVKVHDAAVPQRAAGLRRKISGLKRLSVELQVVNGDCGEQVLRDVSAHGSPPRRAGAAR